MEQTEKEPPTEEQKENELPEESGTEVTLVEVKERLRNLADKYKQECEETARKRKRNEAEQIISDNRKLFPWQRAQERKGPNKKKSKIEDSELMQENKAKLQERLECMKKEMSTFLREHLPKHNQTLCDQMDAMDTTQLVVRFKKNIMPMWRLGLLNVPVKIMFRIARIDVAALKETDNSVKLFKKHLNDICTEIAEFEPTGLFEEPEYASNK